MKKTDIPAFLAMALYSCGFLASFELMQTRPEPFAGIAAAALAHLFCALLVAFFLPVLFATGKKGRVVAAICIVSGFAVRLPGVDGWLNDWLVRSIIQVGQASLAAISFWLFFCLTPEEKWVDRFVLAWLAGMAGKETIVAVGGRAPSALYLSVGLALGLNAAAALACVAWGRLQPAAGITGNRRIAWKPLAILAGNTFVIAVVLGLLSGWIGSFHVGWAKASLIAPRIAAPAMLVLAGWNLRRDFTAGFIRMVRLCAVLCLALAGMSVLDRGAVPVGSMPYLAVACQTVFYFCTTLAMARLANSPRAIGLAVVAPYAAMIVSGLVAYERTPLGDHHFSLMILLCLAAFLTFFVSAKALDFAIPANQRVNMDLDSFFKYYQLSTREQEVTALLARGLPNADIARKLYLSRHTINSHVRNVCEKAGVRSRAQLMTILRDCVQYDT
ncbi:MAG: helix-turn-helix transcriptional regulator [Planctomycetes bacterium]|nr:helix-turn-helix transcriptional regulator [Planctomycetota bacterium]